ncbi:MAG: alpha/beta hydrolase, partial [Planctomycetota bacterium]
MTMQMKWPLLLLLFMAPFSYANSLIFHPPKASYSDSSNIIKIKVENNESISAVYKPNPKSRYTLLFSHGNAEDIGQNQAFFELCQKNGFSVFAYDYRGYGTSDGQPSELNTYKDILATYRYLVNNLQTDPNSIIVHGRSLGSGPSCYLASQKSVGGLILESAFLSVHRVALGATLPFDPYNNLARIKQIECPVLVIHGKRDSVIPFLHGTTLFREANSPKIKYWVNR